MTKKIMLTIKKPNAKPIYGVLTKDILNEVCLQTGLKADEVLASLDKLQKLGILDKEEATVH